MKPLGTVRNPRYVRKSSPTYNSNTIALNRTARRSSAT
jgi:hypothetical protein